MIRRSSSLLGPRSACAIVLATFAALSPDRGGVPAASAGQIASSFTVQTAVTNGCSLTVNNLTFPSYVSGQTTPDNGSSSVQIVCAGASAGSQVPITYTVNATGGFKMANGAKTLNYELCWDAACTQVVQNGKGNAMLVDRQVYDVPYYGQIAARQSVTGGVYSQVVNVTLQW